MVPSQLISKSPGVPTSSRSVIVRSSRQIFQHRRKRRMSPAKRGRYSKYPSGGFYLGIRTWMRLRVVQVRSSHILRRVIKYGAVALSAIRLRLLFKLLFREESFEATQMRSSPSRLRALNRLWNRDAQAVSPAPRLGGLAQPWRLSPAPPGSPLLHGPGSKSGPICRQHCMIRRLATSNSSNNVSSRRSTAPR
jgi:hypothetical protein